MSILKFDRRIDHKGGSVLEYGHATAHQCEAILKGAMGQAIKEAWKGASAQQGQLLVIDQQ